MSLAVTRKAFIDWIRNVTTYSADKVIWSEQNMPRPAKPYITARLSAFNNLNHPYTGPNDITGKSKMYYDKEFTLSLDCYATNAVDPLSVLIDLHVSLSNISPYTILSDAGIAFVDTLLGPNDITSKVDTLYEKRATMDLLMRVPWTVEDANQGMINTVGIDSVAIAANGITINNSLITVSI